MKTKTERRVLEHLYNGEQAQNREKLSPFESMNFYISIDYLKTMSDISSRT